MSTVVLQRGLKWALVLVMIAGTWPMAVFAAPVNTQAVEHLQAADAPPCHGDAQQAASPAKATPCPDGCCSQGDCGVMSCGFSSGAGVCAKSGFQVALRPEVMRPQLGPRHLPQTPAERLLRPPIA